MRKLVCIMLLFVLIGCETEKEDFTPYPGGKYEKTVPLSL